MLFLAPPPVYELADGTPVEAPTKESARIVRRLVKSEETTLDLDVVRLALDTDRATNQQDHGRLGGMLAGRIGSNKYVAEYATDCRAKCRYHKCKAALRIGEPRIELRRGEAVASRSPTEPAHPSIPSTTSRQRSDPLVDLKGTLSKHLE